MVVRERHVEALRRARAALDRVLGWSGVGAAEGVGDACGTAVVEGRGAQTLDVMVMELEEAAKHLGAIVGRHVDTEVLDRIFAEFCLGK